MHSDRRGVALQAESSPRALDKLNELALLAPAIELPRAKAIEITKPAESPAPEKIERIYSDGTSTERWKFWVSSLPLSLILGDGFYLYFTGSPESIAGAVMLAGFVVFGLIGLLIEQQRLREFVCPRCQAPIGDWDTNEKYRILFNCARCESRWDIEYKPLSIPLEPVKRLRRSYFSILCSCRGSAAVPQVPVGYIRRMRRLAKSANPPKPTNAMAEGSGTAVTLIVTEKAPLLSPNPPT